MASNITKISEISLETINGLSNFESWTSFLRTAAWQFKYSFADQILIYAQRPNAKACASFKWWNEHGRWIIKNTSGIGLLREDNNGYKISYVYDLYDTRSVDGKNFNLLWQYDKKYEAAVIETLENTFGGKSDNYGIEFAIQNAVKMAVEDNKIDYLRELKYAKENSFLEDLDEFNVNMEFEYLLDSSVGYMIMERLGLDPQNFYERDDFTYINDFNTPETLNILGMAASSITEQALREIAKTIYAERKKDFQQRKIFAAEQNISYNGIAEEHKTENKIDERTETDVNADNLHADRRLPISELDSTTADGADRQIRNDAEDISQRKSAVQILDNADEGRDIISPVGNRQAGERASESLDGRNGEETGRDGAVESGQSYGMGGYYEQPKSRRRRNRYEQPDTQLSLFELLPSEEEQQNIVKEAARSTFVAAFSMPQEEFDTILKSYGMERKCEIYEYFTETPTTRKERAAYLKKRFNNSGKSYDYLDGSRGYVSYDKKGLHIEKYGGRDKPDIIVKWTDVAQRIGELIGYERYLTQEEKAYYPTYIKEKNEQNERYDIGLEMVNIFNEYNEDKEYPDTLNNYLYISAAHEFMSDNAIVHARKGEGESVTVVLMEGLNIILDNEPELYADRINAVIEKATPYLDIPKRENELAPLSPFERYQLLKERNPVSLIAVQIGDFYEFYEADAELVAKIRDLTVIQKTISDTERVAMCGIPKHTLKDNVDILRAEGHSVVIASIDEATKEHTVQRLDSTALQTYGKVFDEYSPVIVSKVLNNDEYTNACKNSTEADARLECDEAVKKAVLEFPIDENADFYKMYFDMPHFQKELNNYAWEQTYPVLAKAQSVPVYDREAEIIADILSAIGRNDVRIEFDSEGIVGIIGDKEMHGNKFYGFLINEVILANNGLNKFKLKDEAFVDFTDLMMHNGMEAELNKAAEKILEEIGYKPKSPKSSHTFEHRNYLMLKRLAPEILSGESSYMRFVAGEAIMPLSINYLSGNRIAVSHYYSEYGDMIADPDMEFIFDNEAQTLTARTFQQGSLYQNTETPQGINKALERDLNSFTNMWFKNNEDYGFVKEIQRLKWQDEQIELTFDKDGNITSIVGTPETVQDYIATHNLELEQISEDTFGIIADVESAKPESELAEHKAMPEQAAEVRHNFRITNDKLGHGTPTEKYEANVAAIKTLKLIESENRLATPDEQEVLSGYVGWGGLDSCFEESNKHYEELKELLTDDEYTSARASVLTSFYTPPVIIRAMYKALDNMGYKTGNILDAACGTGHFIGMLPENMATSKMYGVEIDSISGRIARQLYQNSNIDIKGFEDTMLPDSFFDVAVGNVPFGNYKLFDKKYDKQNFLIHDYFFAKTIDKIRPGGVIAYITSNGIGGGTMDKPDDRVRRYIAERCELIGAVRLPINAFLANAGTRTNTDIIFLQKLPMPRSIEEDAPDWIDTEVFYEKDYTDSEGKYTHNVVTINKYFKQHPEMILGNLDVISGPFGPQLVCKPNEEIPLSKQLDKAIANLNADIPIPEYDFEDSIDNDAAEYIPADENVKNFSFTLVDGVVYFRENGLMNKVDMNKTAINRIKGLIELRDCTRKLIDLQLYNAKNEEIQEQQAELNRIYDAYVEKYDRINSRGNELAFSDDSSYYLLCSLEVLDNKGNFERKADMFTKRTIKNYTPVQSVETATEALEVSIGERACVDMGFMQRLSGKTFEELETELQGIIFRDVKCPTDIEEFNAYTEQLHRYPYVMADEYLSGDVRLKLKMAETMREAQPENKKHLLDANIEALKKVQPKDLEASDIYVRLGTHWIPTEVYRQFIFELLETPENYRKEINVFYSDTTGDWNVTGKSADRSNNVKAVVTYGTSRVNAYHLIQDCLRFKNTKVYDKVNDNPVLNKEETAAAQERQELIKQAFKDWIWKDPNRRETLTRYYNETMNNIRPREYDGSHLKLVGMNPEITLLPHQRDAVARGIYGGNTYLAHCVGAGKTFEMTTIAMEAKRLGLCQKSMFVVPNNLVGQWASEIYTLYPAANILVASKKDFEARNRKKLCARIATGEYDIVIIGHSQLVKLPISVERQVALLQKEINEISAGIVKIKMEKQEGFSLKQLERTKKSLLERLKRLTEAPKKDNVVAFEELGVDKLFIDEADEFKNLFLYTKMTDVAGISQTEAQKATDLYMKSRYMDELTDYKGNIHASGTPISNSMVELYTAQRYLQYNELEKRGLIHFDAWAAQYGETVTAMELAPEGSGYRQKTRFAKFNNLPELMAMFKEVADIKTADMLNLPTPEKELINVKVAASPIQKDYIADLAERAEAVRNRDVEPNEDNMLKITNDGRRLALDQRLVNPLFPDYEGSKVNACVKNVFDIWQSTADKRLTQLVFCDLSTPTSKGFNVYDDFRDKLVAMGIPREEIVFIHEAYTDAKKIELFTAVRNGDVRVLMGSTAKMGAGMNVQNKLIALHNLDCPWRPRDMEQRMGRIVRRGNENEKVSIYTYVTEDTFDSYMYQILENKQRFISQVMTGKSPARSADDIDEAALTYAEVKALATGNPLIKEKMELETTVQKLKVSRNNFENQRYRLEDAIIKYLPNRIAEAKGKIEVYTKDAAIYAEQKQRPLPKDVTFHGMTIDGKHYDKKEAAGKALLEMADKIRPKTFIEKKDRVPIGEYMGFKVCITASPFGDTFDSLSLKGNAFYDIEMGDDAQGNIQRIDNALGKIESTIEDWKRTLSENENSLEQAKIEYEKPYEREAEYQSCVARLAELTAILTVQDEKPVIDTSVSADDVGEQTRKRNKDMER